MKTLANRIAFALVTLGLVGLLYSISVFFYPQDQDVSETPVNQSQATGATSIEEESPPLTEPAATPPPPPALPFVKPVPGVRKIVREQTLVVARTHLNGINLSMDLPTGIQYGEATDGDYQILYGSNGQGRVGLILFSTRQKTTADKMRLYFEGFMKDGLDVQSRGKGKPFANRSGVGAMVQFTGTVGRNEEYQAFYFQNKKSKRSHLLVLVDRNLSRHPARLRVLLDSIH